MIYQDCFYLAKKQLSKGHSEGEVKEFLADRGFSAITVARVFDDLYLQNKAIRLYNQGYTRSDIRETLQKYIDSSNDLVIIMSCLPSGELEDETSKQTMFQKIVSIFLFMFMMLLLTIGFIFLFQTLPITESTQNLLSTVFK